MVNLTRGSSVRRKLQKILSLQFPERPVSIKLLEVQKTFVEKLCV